MRHAQKQGRKVLSTFMNDRKSRKIPRCKTAVTFETRAQIMLVPHCACVLYNSSGYLDTCTLTRVPSTRISGYLAIRIRVNAASVDRVTHAVRSIIAPFKSHGTVRTTNSWGRLARRVDVFYQNLPHRRNSESRFISTCLPRSRFLFDRRPTSANCATRATNTVHID